MHSEPHVILVEKQPLLARFKPNNFFNTLTTTVQSIAGGNWVNAAKSSLGIVKYETNSGHRAYELIFNALGAAAVGLLDKGHRKVIEGNLVNKKGLFDLKLNKEIEELELEVTPVFFAAPKDFKLIKVVRPIYKEWLVFLGLTKEIAQQLQRKLPHQFLLELTKEWDEKLGYYQLILDKFKTPFYEAWKKEYYTLKYQDELREMIHEPAMGDKKLPLSKIYIKPYFSLYKDCLGTNKIHYEYVYRNDGFISDLAFKENLHNYIKKRVIQKETPLGIPGEKHNFIFILGQPGQGKSSFCLYTINQLLEHEDFEQNLYFIRLKELPHKDELIQHPFNVIGDFLKRKHSLEFITQETVIILDGLDELYMVNGLTNTDLEKFYKHLEEEIKQEPNLTIILTSRYNYLNLSAVNKKKTTILKLNGLDFSQQKEWLRIYIKVHTNCMLSLPKLNEIDQDQNLKHIKELIKQPILLHIVANANTDLSNQDTRSTIYKKLFDALLKRSWENEQLEKYHSLEKEEYAQEFREWLQEIAFSIYSSNFEYIKRKDLEALNGTKYIQSIIKTSSDLKDALKDLLVAFYFKNVQKNEDDEIEEENKNRKYALEFLHKSLQEYLAAEYIWREIKDKILAPHDKKMKFYINDFKQALSLFFGLFSNKGLNDSIRELLIEMVVQDSNMEAKKILRERLKQFLAGCLKYQFLDTTAIHNHTEHDTPPLNKAFNTFRGYWLVLSHLDLTENEDLLENGVQELLSYLVSKGGGAKINLSYANLSYTDLLHADLSYAKLLQADLSYADLRKAGLWNAKLLHADLRNAKLLQADLSYADLRNTDLSEADLSYADLSGANLSHADLSHADLRNADLSEAKLLQADLRNADLSYAKLSYADLSEAKLRNTDLSEADLSYADLLQADLSYAKLLQANLSHADLSEANLSEADLSEANLSEANLKDTKVSSTNFIEQLEQWNCKGIQEIKNKYYVDDQVFYYKWDKEKKYPYYLIKEKTTKSQNRE